MEEAANLRDDAAQVYLESILEKRDRAMREGHISDPILKEDFINQEEYLWKLLETKVFLDKNNTLGFGQTARVKRLSLDEEGFHSPLKSVAVKYLIHPTEKTLSASGEHDLIHEVERIEAIERSEDSLEVPVDILRVPHPYFHYQNGKIQCYGMEEIDGITLEKGISQSIDPGLKEELKEKFRVMNLETINAEVERFFSIMHETCLHGDIKAANLMVSREGRFYVIDFGQSVLARDISDKEIEAFENLKDEEKRNVKILIRAFLDALSK